MTISQPWRKALLTLHVVSSVGWLGADMVLLTLSIAGRTGADPAVVYPAIGLVGSVLLVPISVVSWLVGLASALLTKWGVLRHWWVVVKLAVTTILTALVLFALWPGLREATDLGAALPQETRDQLLIAPSVSFVALTALTAISAYKPWGRTRRTRQTDKTGRTARKDQTGQTSHIPPIRHTRVAAAPMGK
ncbi:hypothetical protein GCM10022251_19060 [Phytohabitans flavus]|nr:DUF2269 domain-containing protein [Phytohabitans flavus]